MLSSDRPRPSRCGGYTLLHLLASGGMGQVWLARHDDLGHHVAIKVLDAIRPDFLGRFEREAKVCARIADQTPHVVRVIDYGTSRGDGEPRPYLVMELLQGQTLAQRVQQEGKLPPVELLDIARQLCHALAATHAAGVVHRDLKPSNVFLCASPFGPARVKLIDFGIAKANPGDGDALTRTGTVLGSPGFISPEQIRGVSDIDGRADLWALAAIVYRALTGFHPFGAGTFEEMTAQILWSEISPPTSLAPELPPALDAWMRRALARHPDDRFATAEELLRALQAALRNEATEDELPRAAPTGRARGADESETRSLNHDERFDETVPVTAPRASRHRDRLGKGAAMGVAALVAVALALVSTAGPKVTRSERSATSDRIAVAPAPANTLAPAPPASTPPKVSALPEKIARSASPVPSLSGRRAARPAPPPVTTKAPRPDGADVAQRSGWHATGEL